jgi:hypothetical protein
MITSCRLIRIQDLQRPGGIDDPDSVCQISMNGRKGITGRPVKHTEG